MARLQSAIASGRSPSAWLVAARLQRHTAWKGHDSAISGSTRHAE